jgi:hypothetical protein
MMIPQLFCVLENPDVEKYQLPSPQASRLLFLP